MVWMQVPEEFRQVMYKDLVAEMNALPPLLVRGTDGLMKEAYGTAAQEFD